MHTLQTTTACQVSAYVLSWIRIGFVLGSYWIRIGFELDSNWIRIGFVLDSYWIHIGFVLDSYWIRIGFVLDSYWISTCVAAVDLVVDPVAEVNCEESHENHETQDPNADGVDGFGRFPLHVDLDALAKVRKGLA